LNNQAATTTTNRFNDVMFAIEIDSKRLDNFWPNHKRLPWFTTGVVTAKHQQKTPLNNKNDKVILSVNQPNLIA
jgi:hypothetical protein